MLLIFSPNVSGGAVNATTGKAASLFSDPAINFAWFPLNNPGLVSIPLGFLFAIIGTMTSKEYNKAKWAEMEVRSLTGVAPRRRFRTEISLIRKAARPSVCRMGRRV